MSKAYVLTILVATGDPEGVRTVEKSNWTGLGVTFGRSDLATAAELITLPGVYILLGEDQDEDFDGQIYVGQGEKVGARLQQHQRDDAKEFWTHTVVFVSKDSSLNRAHLLYLEADLIGLAHTAKRVRIANKDRPARPVLSPAAEAEAAGFLAEMLAILPVIGVRAFERPTASSVAARRRYFLKGPDTYGEGEERPDGFLVLAGARGRVTEAEALSPGYSRMRERLVSTGVFVEEGGGYRLVEDRLFRSPSRAAAALLGRNSNGRVEWKDANGTTLKQHQIADDGAAPEETVG